MSTPPTSTGRRRGPWRWFVALLATVLLVVSGSGLVAFAQSGAAAGRGPAFVPADAPIYAVARLDMPDGQLEAVASFMSAFPGFSDTAGFETKVDQALDEAISGASGGDYTYTGDLEGFVTGEVALALLDFTSALMFGQEPGFIAGVAISDRAAAETFVAMVLAEASDEVTELPYSGATIFSGDDMAVAVHDEWILFAQSAEQVQIGIDVLEGTTASLDQDEDFSQAWARVPAAHLGAAYIDLASFTSLIELAGMAAAGQTGMPFTTEELIAALPEDMVAYLAASPDRLSFEVHMTQGEASDLFPVNVGESELATLFPADTQIYVEVRELGSTLERTLTQVFEMMEPEDSGEMAFIEDALGTPVESFLDFVSDVAIGGALDSDGLWLGLAAEVVDEATAAIRVERLLSFVRLASVGEDSGISLTERDVNGTTVTTITVPIDEGMAASGVPFGFGDTIEVTIDDGMLLIGTGDFVENALAGAPTGSLATSDGYVDALAGDMLNTGVVYANVSGLLATIDPLLSLMSPEWAEIQPYATALDRIVLVGTADDEVISARMQVIVDQ